MIEGPRDKSGQVDSNYLSTGPFFPVGGGREGGLAGASAVLSQGDGSTASSGAPDFLARSCGQEPARTAGGVAVARLGGGPLPALPSPPAGAGPGVGGARTRGCLEGFRRRAAGADVVRLLPCSRAHFRAREILSTSGCRCAGLCHHLAVGQLGPCSGQAVFTRGPRSAAETAYCEVGASADGPRSSEPGWLLS